MAQACNCSRNRVLARPADGQLPSCSCQSHDPSSFWGGVSGIHVSFVLAADLSSYTPKHSVKFSKWQEQKYEEMPAKGPLLKEADSHGNQVMVRLQSGFCLCSGVLSLWAMGGTGSAFSRAHLRAVAHLPGQWEEINASCHCHQLPYLLCV